MNEEQPFFEQTTAILQGGGRFSWWLFPPGLVLGISAVIFLLLSFFVNPTIEFEEVHLQEQPTQSAKNKGSNLLSPVFTPEVQFWGTLITAWAQEWGIDPNLAATVMQIESCGDPQAKSRAGAIGLFQVMPYHFASGENPYKPETNAYRGLAYLNRALEEFNGDARMALAGYNGGITGVKRAELFWPSETKRYAYWGANIYNEALSGGAGSPTLDEWLGSGGDSLCTQASQQLGLFP